jgi:hypothetical protein
MSHIALEDLARLVDEAPGAHEAAHLGTCEECRLQLNALREDVQALSMLPDMAPPADSWAAIERRLTDEGLIRTRRRLRGVPWPGLVQMAAALVLFIAGSLAGRISAGPGGPMMADAAPAATAPLPTAGSNGAAPQGPTTPAPVYVATGEPDTRQPDAQQRDAAQPAPRTAPAPNPNVTLASSGFDLGGLPGTMDEAIIQLRQAEDLYLTALTRYAEMATQAEAGDPVARLAALQSIVMTTQAALNQTPTDPVINGYHLTALAQRDAALRQVAAVTGDRWY